MITQEEMRLADKRDHAMRKYHALKDDLMSRYYKGRMSFEDYSRMLLNARQEFEDQYYEHYHYRD